MSYAVYLSGEIHSDWRGEITQALQDKQLDVEMLAPVCNHEASDEVGVRILGDEEKPFWQDHKAAKINAIRTRALIDQADIVVVKFGERYRQWNAAFDAGYAVAKQKSLIVMHDPALTHALKEVDASAAAVVTSNEQVIEILEYLINA